VRGMRQMFARFTVSLACLVSLSSMLTGCTSIGDVRDSRGKGLQRTYEASYDMVWEIVPAAMNDVDLAVVGQSEQDGYVLGSRGMTAFSWGERVAVFLERAGLSSTLVEVVSKKRLETNITAKNFERALHDAIDSRLSR
jgi:hypothetical protein